jgi:Tfp pilus assembly protein PilN
MLNLLKKNAGTEGRKTPRWRPDFRKLDALPDIKSVRTSFFVNLACITAALILLGITLSREFQVFTINKDLSKTETEIQSLDAANKKALATYSKFQSEVKVVDEIQAHLGKEGPRSDLFLHIAKTLPARISLSRIEHRGTNLILAGSAIGNYTEAVAEVSTYERQLREDAFLKTTYATVTQGGISRDNEGNTPRVLFEITLAQPTPTAAKTNAK